MKKYGLYHIERKELLGVYTNSNSESDFCVSVEYTLETSSENVWLVDTYEQADWARITNTDWFNAGYRSPANPYKPNELKVVEIKLEFDHGDR